MTTLALSRRLVMALEEHNAGAVDVECAIARGELFLLQCRPVTTLGNDFPLEWNDPRMPSSTGGATTRTSAARSRASSAST